MPFSSIPKPIYKKIVNTCSTHASVHYLWANMQELDADTLMTSTFDHTVKRIRVTPCATHREQQGGNDDGGGGVPELENSSFLDCLAHAQSRPP